MNSTNENIAALMKVLDPNDNSTGGGTASAFAGAMAAALAAMVARLSIGKKDMEPEPFYTGLATEAAVLSGELFDGGREDSEAFAGITAGFRMPKETPEQKAARSQVIQEATIHAARVPLANAERCRRALELAAQLRGRSNPNAASDLECAGHLARAGLLGCAANVKINTPSIKDQAVSSDLGQRADALLAWAAAQA